MYKTINHTCQKSLGFHLSGKLFNSELPVYEYIFLIIIIVLNYLVIIIVLKIAIFSSPIYYLWSVHIINTDCYSLQDAEDLKIISTNSRLVIYKYCNLQCSVNYKYYQPI
jgi:hypothetical protein